MKHAVSTEVACGPFGSVPDCGEWVFERVRFADALPVLGGEVIEAQQLVTIFHQTFDGLSVYHVEGFNEQIE